MNLEEKQKKCSDWFRYLRDGICFEFERIEEEFDKKYPGKFERKNSKKSFIFCLIVLCLMSNSLMSYVLCLIVFHLLSKSLLSSAISFVILMKFLKNDL